VSDLLERLRGALADRYTIEREIGSGGMATVYLAEDLRHHRQVAIKVLRPDLAATLGPERFLREIEIAAQLQHPNILPLLDSGEADDFLYYVMPFVEGHSLRDKLAREGELPIGEAVRILRDVVDALTAAHAHGVVHRDIKPENVLLSGRHALVTDFGVAKAVSEATGREQLTTAGVALGTPAYMAPEQATADPHLDHRVDIYAVGAVAYELLTGRPVFMGTTPQMVLSAHVTEAPQPVAKHRDTVPPALEAVVMRCLEKKPADRWQTAEELLPQFEALTTPSGGVTPTDTRPLPASPRRNRWLVPGGLAAVVLIVIGFLGTRAFKRGPISVTLANTRPVTSEAGMEWQPAVSPDGSQVAFVAQRDGRQAVVIKNTRGAVGGGEVVPTRGMHDVRESLPEWRPDGQAVRFYVCPEGWIDCASMETGRLGGSVRPVELPRTDGRRSWSPDGSHIALIGGGTFWAWANVPDGDSIFTYSVTDGTTTLITVPELTYWPNSWPVWSPDGRWIAYVYGADATYQNQPPPSSSIWMVDATGGEPIRVTGDEFHDTSPAWLDADHLLFVSDRDGRREVYVVEVTAAGPRGAPRKVAGGVDAHTISYSIAGQTLAFSKVTVRRNIRAYPIGPNAVSIADGTLVTNENADIQGHDLSPDGRWIVYASDVGHPGNLDLYGGQLEGGTPAPIADSPREELDPQWSPDRTEVAFALTGDQFRIMIAAADGSRPVQVASAPVAWLPRWSPSGLELAFSSSQSGALETWVVLREAIGRPWGEATQLTDFNCQPGDWAPDGSGVLCTIDAPPYGAEREIVLVSRDGDILWRYDPTVSGLFVTTNYQRFSRDGSLIYAAARRDDGTAGVWAIPIAGGEPRLVIAYDHEELTAGMWLTVGPDRLYLTVGQSGESDIWAADVEVEQ
jgi:Tol biopolymer transport system component